MVSKTRKQRGRGLANLFRKRKPLSSVPVSTGMIEVETPTNNTIVSYKRKGSLTDFTDIKQRKAFAAKAIRNHIRTLKSKSNNVRNEALRLMNNTMRNKTRKLLNAKNLNTLTNDQVLELYQIGKVRSTSY